MNGTTQGTHRTRGSLPIASLVVALLALVASASAAESASPVAPAPSAPPPAPAASPASPACPSPAGFQSPIPLGPILSPPPGPGFRFGSALAVSDGTVGAVAYLVVAVGAYLASSNGTESGTVYLLRIDSSGNCSQFQLRQGGPGDWFGFDVAIDGSTLLVGAPMASNGTGARPGAAYSFDLGDFIDHGGPIGAGTRLPIPPGQDGDQIGSAVAASGGAWAVGARGDSQAGAGAGKVYVCCRQGRVEPLVPDAAADGAGFGQSVSLERSSGSWRLAAGAPLSTVGGQRAGAAYVYDCDGCGQAAWQRTILLGSQPEDAFGYAVALSGDHVVVGAPLDDSLGNGAGAAYLYGLRDGTWQREQRLTAGADAGAQFGVAVSFDRAGTHQILAGARLAGGGVGAAYLFTSTGGLLFPLPLPPQLQPGGEFGFATGIYDRIAVVGAFLQAGGAGNAYLFAPPFAPVLVADLAISLIPGRGGVAACGPVRFRIEVTNQGPDTATGAMVGDQFPAALSGITWTCSARRGARCGAASGGGSQLAELVSLPAGGGVTYEVSARLAANATGSLADQATVSPPTGVFDPQLGNNQSQFTVPIAAAAADLEVLNGAPVTLTAGGTAAPDLVTVINHGPCAAVDTVLVVKLPAALEPLAPLPRACTSGGAGNPGELTCHLGTLDARQTRQEGFTIAAPCDTAAGPRISLAQVSSATADPDAGNNSRRAVTQVGVVADYAIVKTDDAPGGVGCFGLKLTYQLVVTNRGPSCPGGVVVADDFAPELIDPLWCLGAGCSPNQPGDLMAVVGLRPRESATFVASAMIPGSFSLLFCVPVSPLVCYVDNTASVTPPPGVDPYPTNNAASVSIPVLAPCPAMNGPPALPTSSPPKPQPRRPPPPAAGARSAARPPAWRPAAP